MGTSRNGSQFHKAVRSIAAGFMLFGLLGACTKVNVQVDTCAAPGGTRTPLPEPGACSVMNPYSGPLLPQNYKVCKNSSGQTVSCTGNEMCTSGNRCNDAPGSENRKICKTVWTQSSAGSMDGTCNCTSNY
jgi:hypothetical protein